MTTSADGTARVWDAGSGEVLVTLSGHTGSVTGGGFGPDGSRVLTTSYDGTARVWDAGSGEVLLTLSGHTGSVTGGGFGPDGSRVVTTSYDGTARVWDAGSGEVLLTLSGHTDWVSCSGFSPDGSRVLTTGEDGTARIREAATGEQVGWQLDQLPGGEAVVRSVPDHRLLGASPDAWRWLGWMVLDGALVRLPAETYGPLPPLGRAAAAR